MPSTVRSALSPENMCTYKSHLWKESRGFRLEENWHPDILVHSQWCPELVQWLISWNYHQNSQKCIMCSMSHSWEGVSRHPRKRTDREEIELAKYLTYEEKSFWILEEMDRVTRSKVIKFYKVQLEHHTEEEATWKREDFLRTSYPELFSQATESWGQDSS